MGRDLVSRVHEHCWARYEAEFRRAMGEAKIVAFVAGFCVALMATPISAIVGLLAAFGVYRWVRDRLEKQHPRKQRQRALARAGVMEGQATS